MFHNCDELDLIFSIYHEKLRVYEIIFFHTWDIKEFCWIYAVDIQIYITNPKVVKPSETYN